MHAVSEKTVAVVLVKHSFSAMTTRRLSSFCRLEYVPCCPELWQILSICSGRSAGALSSIKICILASWSLSRLVYGDGKSIIAAHNVPISAESDTEIHLLSSLCFQTFQSSIYDSWIKNVLIVGCNLCADIRHYFLSFLNVLLAIMATKLN